MTTIASTPADESGSHSSNSSSAGSWLSRRQHTQSQLLLPLLRARKAVRRVIQQAVSWQRWRLRGVVQRKLSDLDPVQMPNQTNRLALAFSPLQSPPSSFCCGLEVFQPSHVTMPHVHNSAWELFFIISGARKFLILHSGAGRDASCALRPSCWLVNCQVSRCFRHTVVCLAAGSGSGFCEEERFHIKAGDVVAFPPGRLHGIDNADDAPMYTIEVSMTCYGQHLTTPLRVLTAVTATDVDLQLYQAKFMPKQCPFCFQHVYFEPVACCPLRSCCRPVVLML